VYFKKLSTAKCCWQPSCDKWPIRCDKWQRNF